jgi:hypothetical protein
MATHPRLLDTDIPPAVSRKLENLEIKSVRQLYARLRDDRGTLRAYLQLSDEEFTRLYRRIENLVRDEYPQDLLPKIHPTVNKSGVAVHRLHDPTRPKYNKRGQG